MKSVLRSFRLLVPLVVLVAIAVGCSKKTESGTNVSDSGGTPAVPGSDKDRLQGVWAVESVLTDPPEEAPKPDNMKTMRYQFQGDRLSVGYRGRIIERYTVVVKADQNPKLLALTSANEKWEPNRVQVSIKEFREPAKHEWLYKFDGDKLVLAETTEPGERAADFKPRKWVPEEKGKRGPPPVAVITLTKTNEGTLPDKPGTPMSTKF